MKQISFDVRVFPVLDLRTDNISPQTEPLNLSSIPKPQNTNPFLTSLQIPSPSIISSPILPTINQQSGLRSTLQNNLLPIFTEPPSSQKNPSADSPFQLDSPSQSPRKPNSPADSPPQSDPIPLLDNLVLERLAEDDEKGMEIEKM